jgi:hypothetical protein
MLIFLEVFFDSRTLYLSYVKNDITLSNDNGKICEQKLDLVSASTMFYYI